MFSGEVSASVCKKRDENFSEASENRGACTDYRAQSQVSSGVWLKTGDREMRLVKGREPILWRGSFGGDEQLGQDRVRNRY